MMKASIIDIIGDPTSTEIDLRIAYKWFASLRV